MRSYRPDRRPSGALLLFVAVYLAALGVLFAPEGAFLSSPAKATLSTP
ncbi:MAG: hypothetical protein IOC80_10990 [Rhodobacter sp.]|nr:hypothetical protein [Rhodobacter sp.]MCA3512800.1 hypothetical protein [Rhodobacter sp.]MCA3521415.1 hypothetical protein [Rhodobacter sp.]MCA3521748.1 hypothetical protein [Rhodobacter sp.]MCA3526994.1 hypothetical protein [Rhodobacter sp.]